jgi:hypothetical protein
MCYWCSVSLLAWGVLSLTGIYWHPLHASSAATICLAVGTGCVAGWCRHRTQHCAITGPLFLIAGMVFLFAEIGAFIVNPRWVWSIVAIATGIALFVEWRSGVVS